jgi:hypothetical protein
MVRFDAYSATTTEAKARELLSGEFNRQPETLKDFELWLLHRAHRPDEFSDAELCGQAWQLTKEYRASLASKGGD